MSARGLLLALAAGGVYLGAIGNDLALDAGSLVAGNPYVRDLSRLPALLTSDYWAPELVSGLYRPAVTVSWATQHALGATGAVAHNAVNLLLHAAVTLLAWRLFLRLAASPAVAFAGALLFAVHAVHTEVVANAAGRAELLATTFSLAALLAYLRIREEPRRTLRFGALCAGSYGLALLSKENAAALLGVLPLYEILYGEGRGALERAREALRRRGAVYAGLLAVTLLVGALRLAAIGDAPVPEPSAIDNPLVRLDAPGRILTALQVLLRYLGLLLAPVQLSYDYSYDAVPLLRSLAQAAAWAVLAGVLAVGALGVWSRRLGPDVPFGLGFAGIALLPVSNLFVTVGTILGERLLYLPSVGFCLALAAALHAGCRRLLPPRRAATAFVLAVGILGALHAGRTLARVPVWRTETRLFLHDVEVVPRSAKAQANAGKALQDLGRHGEAIARLERALAIAPEMSTAYTNLAYSLSALGRHREAAALLETQMRRGHGHPALYNNLGFLLIDQGLDVRRGVALLERAVAESPDDPEFLDSLAWGYFKQGRLEEAQRLLRRSLRLDPDGPTAPARRERLLRIERAHEDDVAGEGSR